MKRAQKALAPGQPTDARVVVVIGEWLVYIRFESRPTHPQGDRSFYLFATSD